MVSRILIKCEQVNNLINTNCDVNYVNDFNAITNFVSGVNSSLILDAPLGKAADVTDGE